MVAGRVFFLPHFVKIKICTALKFLHIRSFKLIDICLLLVNAICLTNGIVYKN